MKGMGRTLIPNYFDIPFRGKRVFSYDVYSIEISIEGYFNEVH